MIENGIIAPDGYTWVPASTPPKDEIWCHVIVRNNGLYMLQHCMYAIQTAVAFKQNPCWTPLSLCEKLIAWCPDPKAFTPVYATRYWNDACFTKPDSECWCFVLSKDGKIGQDLYSVQTAKMHGQPTGFCHDRSNNPDNHVAYWRRIPEIPPNDIMERLEAMCQ